jgi:predicted enzyme related to lactoylglutathione lyase
MVARASACSAGFSRRILACSSTGRNRSIPADTMLSVALPQNRTMTQPLSWFEIPALDFARARSFYEKLFALELQEHTAGPNIMAVFPYDRERTSGGCVMKGPALVPTNDGVIIYLNAGESLDNALSRVQPSGGEIVFPKTQVPGIGFFAHIKDTEGNRVGLFAVK